MVKIGRQKNRPNTLVSPAPVRWRTLAVKVYYEAIQVLRNAVGVLDFQEKRVTKVHGSTLLALRGEVGVSNFHEKSYVT